MPRDLVEAAIGQAEGREPVVRAMLLLHAARVLAALDAEAARGRFAEGLAILESLPAQVHNRYHDYLLFDAVMLGAEADLVTAVALFQRLAQDRDLSLHRNAGTHLVQCLVRSGDLETAVRLLENPAYQIRGAAIAMSRATDPAIERRIFHAAREHWRARGQSTRLSEPFLSSDFYRLFSTHWKKLDPAEARAWLEEIIAGIERDADGPASMGFGDRVRFQQSSRAAHLFWVLNVMRAIWPPERVEALLDAYPELKSAAEVYPLGVDSLMAEHPPRETKDPPKGRRMGFVGSGSMRRDERYRNAMMAVFQGEASGVEQLMADAHQRHTRDTGDSPQTVASIFRASCHRYRTALYWAGKITGKEAQKLLGEIPDPDMALLATMDFAAGLLGIPQYTGIQIGQD